MTTEKTNKSLFAEIRDDHKKADQELKKLPASEQKKIKKGQASLREKWDKQPYY